MTTDNRPAWLPSGEYGPGYDTDDDTARRAMLAFARAVRELASHHPRTTHIHHVIKRDDLNAAIAWLEEA
jgi:hypothetical protein